MTKSIMKKLDDVIHYLHEVRQRNRLDVDGFEAAKKLLSQEKAQCVANEDQYCAKAIWCLEAILKIQHVFADAFSKIKSGEFYDAWVLLERVEIAYGSLEKHYDVGSDEYYLRSILKHTEQFQSLYPYKLFLSPAAVHKRKSCSICGAQITIRNGCGHETGEIYDGEMCRHIVEEVRFPEISIVPNPVQKYSVMWLTKDGKQIDHYDYSNVAYVAAGLRNPFDGWDLQRTMIREPHSHYRDTGRNERCPCGSNLKYKNCCLRENGVLKPHARIMFEIEPPDDIPQFKGSRESFPYNPRNSTLSRIKPTNS